MFISIKSLLKKSDFSLAAPQKVKCRLTIWPSNSVPRCLPRRTENTRLCEDWNDHSSISHHSPKVETAQMSISWWVDKHNVVYPHNGLLFTHKKEWSADAPTWTNLENIIITERSQTQKAAYDMMPFLWRVQKRQICREGKQMSGYEGLGQERDCCGHGVTCRGWKLLELIVHLCSQKEKVPRWQPPRLLFRAALPSTGDSKVDRGKAWLLHQVIQTCPQIQARWVMQSSFQNVSKMRTLDLLLLFSKTAVARKTGQVGRL